LSLYQFSFTKLQRSKFFDSLSKNIRNRIKRTKVFVTVDIDVVDPAFAPGTGTPEVGGFTSGEVIDLVRGLKD